MISFITFYQSHKISKKKKSSGYALGATIARARLAEIAECNENDPGNNDHKNLFPSLQLMKTTLFCVLREISK